MDGGRQTDNRAKGGKTEYIERGLRIVHFYMKMEV